MAHILTIKDAVLLQELEDAFFRLKMAENSAAELEGIEPLCHRMIGLEINESTREWNVVVEFGMFHDRTLKPARITCPESEVPNKYTLRWI